MKPSTLTLPALLPKNEQAVTVKVATYCRLKAPPPVPEVLFEKELLMTVNDLTNFKYKAPPEPCTRSTLCEKRQP